jgi:hypothetical protein
MSFLAPSPGYHILQKETLVRTKKETVAQAKNETPGQAQKETLA